MTDGCNIACFHQIFQRFHAPAGIMTVAFVIIVVHIFPFGPVCTHCHKGTCRNFTISLFPFLNVFNCCHIVPVVRYFCRYINDAQRQDHFFHSNILQFSAARNEMYRRVYMGTILAYQTEFMGTESNRVIKQTQYIHSRKTSPVRCFRRKFMCQIHKSVIFFPICVLLPQFLVHLSSSLLRFICSIVSKKQWSCPRQSSFF